MPRIIQQYREEVRRKIVDAAYGIFLEKGYTGTTMEEIAVHLGVTKPALYQYFPGKETLYAAVTDRCREELYAILDRSYKNRNIRDGSIALFDALADFVPKYNAMYVEMTLLGERNDEIKTMLRQDRRKDLQVVEQFIVSQQETGLVSRGLDPRTLALACDALIHGLLMDIMMGLDKNEAKAIWIAGLERLIRAD